MLGFERVIWISSQGLKDFQTDAPIHPSGAPELRKIGNLWIQKPLVMTSPYDQTPMHTAGDWKKNFYSLKVFLSLNREKYFALYCVFVLGFPLFLY